MTRQSSWAKWYHFAGWNKTYVNAYYAFECVNVDVWTDAKFTNGIFCWPSTIYVIYNDVTFIGWYDGYYQGSVYSTYTNAGGYGCPPLHYHTKLKKTKG